GVSGACARGGWHAFGAHLGSASTAGAGSLGFRWGWAGGNATRSLAEQASCDDLELEDRPYSLEDRQHLCVHDVTADRVLLGVTPAAVQKLADLRHFDRNVARKKLGLGRDRGCLAFVFVHRPCSSVGDRPR